MLARGQRSGKHTPAEQGRIAPEKFRMNSPQCATLVPFNSGYAMKRLVILVLIVLLAGCATYDDYAYYDRNDYYEDRYCDDRYDDCGYDDRRHERRYEGPGYSSPAYRYPTYGYSSPDYVVYNTYYSSLWPIYRSYYDPFWSPGFYYGVTYFPRTYFGLNVGWYSWPYYQAYSPYRYSHSDHYYDWMDHSRDHAGYVQQHGGYLPRYGSARNEAQYLANRTGARGAGGNAYYGASTQPGGIVDPTYARQARGRGQQLPFERGGRDWNVQPYGRDGRNYGGFLDDSANPARSGRGELNRGGSYDSGRGNADYNDSAPTTRTPRGYDRGSVREDGEVSPAPSMRGRDDLRTRREPIRDERSFDETPQVERSPGGRAYGGQRGAITPTPTPRATSEGEFMPRQTREPYNPIFERHATPSREVEPQFETRSREVYRGRPVESREVYQPSMPVERSYERTQPRFERTEPTYQRSEPTYQRSEPSIERSQPVFERSEPRVERSAPSYERSEPRSAPSYSPPADRGDSGDSGGGRGSSSDDDGGGRSSRGQLDRIVRDDE